MRFNKRYTTRAKCQWGENFDRRSALIQSSHDEAMFNIMLSRSPGDFLLHIPDCTFIKKKETQFTYVSRFAAKKVLQILGWLTWNSRKTSPENIKNLFYLYKESSVMRGWRKISWQPSAFMWKENKQSPHTGWT